MMENFLSFGRRPMTDGKCIGIHLAVITTIKKIMSSSFNQFLELHHQSNPLLIGNVWNVQSAKVFEKQKFKAIATSSAAVAETLGYADGEEMSFEEYLFVAKHITQFCSLPVSVDMESGYGESPEEIAKNLRQLSEVGVVGVNLEDSKIINGKREIISSDRFAKMLKEIYANLEKQNIKVFINVRCDAFLLGLPNALDEALQRTKAYENTGADGLFFPCISKIDDIKKVTGSTKLPVNVMCMPDLPDFESLKNAGVKRISMGNFVNKKLYQDLEKELAKTIRNGSFGSLFSNS
jgi:2-methylisocitrate lyase-like PEP mutase family enzyme